MAMEKGYRAVQESIENGSGCREGSGQKDCQEYWACSSYAQTEGRTYKRPEMELNVEAQFEEFIPESKDLVPEGTLPTGDIKDDLMGKLMAGIDDEKVKEELEKESLTPDSEILRVFAKTDSPTEPSAPKRLNVLNVCRSRVLIKDVADTLSMTENNVKMHLRYLHEKDGYGYTLYKDGTVIINI